MNARDKLCVPESQLPLEKNSLMATMQIMLEKATGSK